MKTSDVLQTCLDMLERDQLRGSTMELFKRCFPNSEFNEHSFDDINETFDNIHDIDVHTMDAITAKMNRSLMDLSKEGMTVGEMLMNRLRLENAVSTLTVLSESKTPVEVLTTIDEEALLWSLTTLWSAGRIQWAYHTALAFSLHRESAICLPS